MAVWSSWDLAWASPLMGWFKSVGLQPSTTGRENTLDGGGRAAALGALPLFSRFSSRSKRPVPGGERAFNPDPGLSLQANTRKGRSAARAARPLRAPAPGSGIWRLPRGGWSPEVGSGARAQGSDVTARPQSRSLSRLELRYGARPGARRRNRCSPRR